VIASPVVVPPPAALAAAPARLVLPASQRGLIRVANTGGAPLEVRVTRAGLTLGREGRPAIAATAAPAGWLLVSRTRFRIRAHRAVRLVVRAGPLRSARPGDHSTLLLLSAQRPSRGGVRVALRVGVVVVLRARGRIEQQLSLGSAHLRRRGNRAVLRIGIVNRGNLDEWIGGSRVQLTLRRAGHVLARPAIVPRRLLARSSGVLLAAVRLRGRGPYRLEARLLRPRPRSPAVRRVYRIVL